MTENPNFVVNEKRLPATVKKLFGGTVYEIVSELLQNAPRIVNINFSPEDGDKNIIVTLSDKRIIPLKIATHTYFK